MKKKVTNSVQEKRRAAARRERGERGVRFRNPPDDGVGAFPPVAEGTPGQAESHVAFERFNAGRDKTPWWAEYLGLRMEGWDWRKAALIAWMASPKSKRWPRTQQELATECLGLDSDRVLRVWREDDAEIDERVARLQVEPLFEHRRDVIDALVSVAKAHDPKAHGDRKLFLEMSGDYRPKGGQGDEGEKGTGSLNVAEVVAAMRKAEKELVGDGGGDGE